MVSAVIVETRGRLIIEPGFVVLEVVQDTNDGTVGVLRSEGRETDVLESDVPLVAIGIIV